MWIIAGLGNPGEGYEKTRHNTGRMIVAELGDSGGFSEWKEDKKIKAHVSKGKVGSSAVTLMLPDTFMNKSGDAVKQLVKNAKQAEQLVVVYDDLDLPLGAVRIAFGRNSGGHRGVESIVKSLRTKNFTRIRIGVSPTTPKGVLKKPKGNEQVLHFIMDAFAKKEADTFQKASKRACEALKTVVEEGRVRAMNQFN